MNQRVTAALPVLLLGCSLVLLTGCSSAEATSPAIAGATSDASVDAEVSPEAGAVDAGGSAASCTTLALGDAKLVTPKQRSGEPPKATGGALADGVYELTAAEFYGPGTAGDLRAVFSVAGSTVERVMVIPPATELLHAKYELSVSGTTMALSMTCSDEEEKENFSYSYSATPTQIVRISKQGAATLVGTFTKR